MSSPILEELYYTETTMIQHQGMDILDLGEVSQNQLNRNWLIDAFGEVVH